MEEQKVSQVDTTKKDDDIMESQDGGDHERESLDAGSDFDHRSLEGDEVEIIDSKEMAAANVSILDMLIYLLMIVRRSGT